MHDGTMFAEIEHEHIVKIPKAGQVLIQEFIPGQGDIDTSEDTFVEVHVEAHQFHGGAPISIPKFFLVGLGYRTSKYDNGKHGHGNQGKPPFPMVPVKAICKEGEERPENDNPDNQAIFAPFHKSVGVPVDLLLPLLQGDQPTGDMVNYPFQSMAYAPKDSQKNFWVLDVQVPWAGRGKVKRSFRHLFFRAAPRGSGQPKAERLPSGPAKRVRKGRIGAEGLANFLIVANIENTYLFSDLLFLYRYFF